MVAIKIPPEEGQPVPQPKPHVLMLTMPAPGHLLPTIALGKSLARQGIKVTCLSSGTVSVGLRRNVEDEFDQLDMTLGSVVEDPVAEPEHPTKLFSWLQKLSSEEMVEHAEAIFNGLTPRPCCFICDVFIGWAPMLEKKINLQRHFLITMSAASLAFMFAVPEFSKQGLLPRDLCSDSRKLVVPGLQTVPDSDIWEYFIKGSPFQMNEMIWVLENLTESMVNSTYLVNSCEELEPGVFEALREPIPFTGESARVLPIGPLETSFAVKDSERNEHNPLGTVALEKEQKLSGEVEQWLDNQPSGSVLYIAFGSIFSLPAEQIREVAHALEASGQRFLWILRPPETPQVMVSKQNFKDELKDLLPSGFEERTRDRGKLYSSWVMQPTVLAHPAVGLFMSHCGWNSILEAVSTCTPIIACPCFVDQHVNARFVVDIFRIGSVAKNPQGKYERGHMESVIRNMMEGEEGKAARNNVTKLNKVLRDAVSPSSGSSAKNLQQYVAEIFAMAKAQAFLQSS